MGGVGGTAKDGGLSTAASVADGGPSAQQPDNTSQYLPPGGESREKPFTRSEANAQTSNPAPGVEVQRKMAVSAQLQPSQTVARTARKPTLTTSRRSRSIDYRTAWFYHVYE